jgi:hypothetical protein
MSYPHYGFLHVVGHDQITGAPVVNIIEFPDTSVRGFKAEDEGENHLPDTEQALILPQIVRIDPHDRRLVRIGHVVPDRTLPDLAIGDVVLVPDLIGWPVDDHEIHQNGLRLAEPIAVIGNTKDALTAIEIANEKRKEVHDGSLFFSNYDASRMHYEVSAVLAQREPNEALVIAWYSDRGEIEAHVLMKSGISFFYTDGDGCSDCGIEEPEEPGLWILKNGKSWVGRDWETGVVDEWGIDGDYERVTLEQAAAYAGMSVEDLIGELDEIYPYVLDYASGTVEAINRPKDWAAEIDGPVDKP